MFVILNEMKDPLISLTSRYSPLLVKGSKFLWEKLVGNG